MKKLLFMTFFLKVVLLDNKEESMNRACSRIKSLGLKNVTFYLANLDYFTGHFDVGTTLHACGTATDLVLKKCLQSRYLFMFFYKKILYKVFKCSKCFKKFKQLRFKYVFDWLYI